MRIRGPLVTVILFALAAPAVAAEGAEGDAATSATPAETTPASAAAPAVERPPSDTPVPGKTTIVVLDLEAIDIDENKMKILNGVVTDQLSGYDKLEIVAQADIRQMVDFEAQKQSLGCDTSSCLAEIAGALGAGYVVFGRVGRLGDVIFAQLNLFDSAKGRAVAREEVRANDLAALPDKLRVAAARVTTSLTGEEPPPMPEDDAARTSSTLPEEGGLGMPLLITGGALTGLGVAGAAGGAIAAVVLDGQLAEAGKTGAQRTDLVTFGWTSLAVAVVGGVVALAGVGLVGASFVVE